MSAGALSDTTQPILVDARTAAAMLSISERTLADWTDVPRFRKGGRVLYSPRALAKWVEEQILNQGKGDGVNRQ